MKHLVSIFVLGFSLLVSLPIIGISSELEKAQETAEKQGDKAQLALTSKQVEYLRIIIIFALATLYVLPLWLVYGLARGEEEPTPPAEMKALPHADSVTITIEASASELGDDFTH